MSQAVTHVRGTSKVLGIIGNPVKHSISPIIHNTIANYLKHDLVYVAFRLEGEKLKIGLDGAHALGIDGMSVTVPHKKAVIPFLTSLDEGAAQIGAVNAIKKTDDGYCGYNTDIMGLEKTFDNESVSIEDKSIVIFGAGGAARAAGLLAAKKNAGRIVIANRSEDNAKNLIDHILRYYNANISYAPLSNIIDESGKAGYIDLVIQTTSVGMHPNTDNSIVEDDVFFQNVDVAFDSVYTPWKTLFLSIAERNSSKIINGFDMLIYQAVAAYEIWNDIYIAKDDAINIKNAVKKYFLKEEDT